MAAPAQRVIALQGASNFRDLGGYHGRGGRPLRWRRLFRSDHLGALSTEDQVALADLGLAAVLDFRGLAERVVAPCAVAGLRQHSLAIEPTVVQSLRDCVAAGEPLTVALAVRLMQQLYRRLIDEEAHRFAEFFAHLLAAEGPLVFHCTAGKDRTGVAAALVLLALGVPRETVVHDYLLSNELYRRPQAPREDLPAEVLATLWSVRPEFLEAALQAVEDEPGGLAGYLRERLGMGEAALRALEARYLQGE